MDKDTVGAVGNPDLSKIITGNNKQAGTYCTYFMIRMYMMYISTRIKDSHLQSAKEIKGKQ